MARRTRPRPQTRQRPSRLAPCLYVPDPTLPDVQDPEHPMCATCSMPWRLARHQQPTDTSIAQAEHRRRIGDEQ